MKFLLDNRHKSMGNAVKIYVFHRLEKQNQTLNIMFSYRCDKGFRPGSVGGLQAPTN